MSFEMNPKNIEEKSFAIISDILKEKQIELREEQAPIIKRVIHTTADFDYAENLKFQHDAVAQIIEGIKSGAHIVTDTNMCKSGINKKVLEKYGGEVHCFIADEDVAKEAEKRNVTRAVISVEKAAKLKKPVIFALGNAPTALIHVCAMMQEKTLNPVAVIGAPVGFVNVVESKEILLEQRVPSIVAVGRKGGSNVAAAIINAHLYMIG